MRIAFPQPSHLFRLAVGRPLLSIVGYQVVRRRTSHAPEALLERADDLLNNWIAAEPLYRQAKLEFLRKRDLS
jgi:hypothetical protein